MKSLATFVHSRWLYIDTLAVFINRAPSKGEMGMLRTMARYVRIENGLPFRSSYRFRLICHVPTTAYFVEVQRLFPRAKVFRVDVVLDLETASAEAANGLHCWCDEHLLLRHICVRAAPTRYEAGTYFRPLPIRGRGRERSRGLQLVIYSSRKSKLSGRDCCHLELRFQSAALLRKIAVQDVASVASLDLKEIYQRYLRAVILPADAVVGDVILRTAEEAARRRLVKRYGGRDAAARRLGADLKERASSVVVIDQSGGASGQQVVSAVAFLAFLSQLESRLNRQLRARMQTGDTTWLLPRSYRRPLIFDSHMTDQ